MNPVIKDTLGLGTLFWLIGYLAAMVLFFTPFANIMGWIMLAVFTPFTIAVTWWWFKKQERHPVEYFAGVGIAWTLIALVLDYLFIMVLLKATTYYGPDVFLYYSLTFFIPVTVGVYLNRPKAAQSL
jgi:cbb3-type cytochrome oxidase subunit 3